MALRRAKPARAAEARELGRFVMFLWLCLPTIMPSTRKVDLPWDLADTTMSDCKARAGGPTYSIAISLVRITPSYTVMVSAGIFRRHTISSGKHGVERQGPLKRKISIRGLLALHITAVTIGISYSYILSL